MGGESAIIRFFNVTKRYGGSVALRDIGLSFGRGEFAFITGPSGAGKSTLLKILYLDEPFDEGEILVDGQNLKRLPLKRLPAFRRTLGVVFQDFKLIDRKTVFDNVALPLEAAGRDRGYVKKKVGSLLRNAGLEQKAGSYPKSLSGGEQQRAAVARALANDPKIILADEPTGSLDPESARAIVRLFLEAHQKGATVLVATHDHNLIQSLDHRVVQLQHGELA